ncbi:MAG: chitobiase/beta-hexosaminidase C-terminal domain-containing protein [Acidobacteriota bacterium]
MGGSSQSNQTVSYGSLKSFSANNTPGSRSGMASWTDKSGNLWIFGGFGYDQNGPEEFSELWELNGSTLEWAWIAGPQTGNQSGVYGTQGTSSSQNHPGARSGAVTWTDASGNLWMFGGEGTDSAGNHGYLNDLWKFDPTALEWTWMGGSSVLPTCPSTNSCGPPGVYGTMGTAAPGNIPGGRAGAVGWTDSSGNFWLFGGRIYIVYLNGWGGYENDLWKYDPISNQWTWMGGSNSPPSSCSMLNTSCGQSGVYGTAGNPSLTNVPGAREGSSTWVDASGNVWLFGGFGFDAAGLRGELNDLWQYDPASNKWVWMKGSDSVGANYSGPSGVYGELQIPAVGNSPGGRDTAASWMDAKGNLWLLGGDGIDANGTYGYLGDLWMFNPGSNQWTWINGGISVDQPAIYGTLGVPSLGNDAGNRIGEAAWTDRGGNLWLFGGSYFNSKLDNGQRADLWEYLPYATTEEPATSAPVFSPSSGTYTSIQSVSLTSSTPNASIYYRINGDSPTLYSTSITVTQSETITAVAVAPNSAASSAATAAYTLNIPPPPTPTISPASGTYSAPPQVTISDSDSYATIYYTTDGSTPSPQSTRYSGPLIAWKTETIHAIAVAGGDSLSPVASATYTILPTPPNTWAYLQGESEIEQGGNYGALGIHVATSYPGSRSSAATWTDANGDFWVFGGDGTDGNGNTGWLNDLWKYSSTGPIQDSYWTWMGGLSTVPCTTTGGVQTCGGNHGSYGTLGTGSTSNIPGSREGAFTWTDSAGRLWLFGGYGFSSTSGPGYLNDLWRFDPTTGQWTWVSGSSTYNFVTQAAAYGQPGVYGTLGKQAPGNVPGGRAYGASWIDSNGNLWLFGGLGMDAGSELVHLNDLWMFNPSSSEWTWMGGSEVVSVCVNGGGECGQQGTYGTLGTPSSSNIPGGRQYAAYWTDQSGNFWLYGGDGYDANDERAALNDLWMYSPSTNKWTWVNGASAVPCPIDQYTGLHACISPAAVTGTLGVASSGNTPGGRLASATWVDQKGNFWLMGTKWMNDMWVFQPSLGQWTWMGGDYAPSNCLFILFAGPGGLYPVFTCAGNQGYFSGEYLFDVGNLPGARSNAATFVDSSGNFRLFSGYMYNLSPDRGGPVNDLWAFQPSVGSLPPAANPVLKLRTGVYTGGGPLTISNGMPNASIYYTTDGTTPSKSSSLYTGPISITSTAHVRAYAVAPGYADSGVAAGEYVFPPAPPAPTFSIAAGSFPSAQTVAISDSSIYARIYYTTDGSAPNSYSTLYTGPITVASSETINAIAVIKGYGVWTDASYADFDGYTSNGPQLLGPVASATYTINLPLAATPTFGVPAGTYTSAQTVTISDSTNGAAIYYTTDGSTPTSSSPLYSGPISVAATETVKAIATASGYSPSAVASAAYTINLAPPGFTGGSGGTTSMTVTPGANSGNTGTISVAGTNGFTGTVSLTCSVTTAIPNANDLPTCAMNPASVTISGSAAQTSTLTVMTTAATSAAKRSNNPLSREGGGAVFAVILLIGGYKRRRRWQAMLGLLLLVLCAGLLACGGGGAGSTGGGGTGPGGGNSGTTPGAYTVKVTGTSGAVTATVATISLTVQ